MGQSAFELELWVENMVKLGKGTTKFKCPVPLHFFSLMYFECNLAHISFLLPVLAACSNDFGGVFGCFIISVGCRPNKRLLHYRTTGVPEILRVNQVLLGEAIKKAPSVSPHLREYNELVHGSAAGVAD